SINRDRDRRLILERQIGDLMVEVPPAPPLTAVPPSAFTQSQTGANGEPSGPIAAQLELARSQLQVMELRLRPSHPDVQRMKRVIADLEKKTEAEAALTPVSVVEQATPSVSPQERIRQNRIRDLRLEVEAIDRQIAYKEESQRTLARTIPEYQRRVDIIPTRESEMIALTRDYDTLRNVYTSLLSKGEDAKVAANLERRQIGEQFKVIDPARLPERPFSPDRTLINAGGIAGGLILALAIIGLTEMADSSLRTDQDVIGALALPVLATVPAIMTREENRMLARRKFLVAAASILIIVSGGGLLVWKLDLLSRFL
ncbi:MAG: GNVR domain-containing protein, partial [Vicinamibacterales bacterium]